MYQYGGVHTPPHSILYILISVYRARRPAEAECGGAVVLGLSGDSYCSEKDFCLLLPGVWAMFCRAQPDSRPGIISAIFAPLNTDNIADCACTHTLCAAHAG
jgi:hypothetical protein